MPDQNNQPVSPEHDLVSFPSGSILGIPKSLPDEVKNSIAAKFHSLESQGKSAFNQITDTTTDAVGSAWDEVKNQGKALKGMFQPPVDTDPEDEKHVALLGPVSLQAYKMGKGVLSAVAAGHLANQSGEGTIGSNLAMYEKMPMVGDLVQQFERGNVTKGIATGLTRAALLKGAADLSSSALSKISPEAEAAAQAHPSIQDIKPAGISAPRMVIRQQFTKTPSGLNPEAAPETEAPVSPAESIQAPPKGTMSAEERLAAAFLRKQRIGNVPKVEVVSPASQSGVNIGGKTVGGKTAADVQPSQSEIQDFITKQYGDKAPNIKIVGEAAAPVSQAENLRLAHDILAKYADKTGDIDFVEQLAALKRRLGIGKPSAEAMKTLGSQTPNDPAIQEYIKSLAGRKSGIPQAKLTSSAEEGGPYEGARETNLTTSDGVQLGYARTSPTEVPGEFAMRNIRVAEKYRNQGHGTRLMQEAALDVKRQGATSLRSDPLSMTPDAHRMWEEMAKKYPVEKFNDPNTGTGYRMPLKNFKPGATRQLSPKNQAMNTPLTPYAAGSVASKSFLGSVGDVVENRLNPPRETDILPEFERE